MGGLSLMPPGAVCCIYFSGIWSAMVNVGLGGHVTSVAVIMCVLAASSVTWRVMTRNMCAKFAISPSYQLIALLPIAGPTIHRIRLGTY